MSSPGTVAWLVLFAGAAILEIVRPASGLRALGRLVRRTLVGRFVLLLFWAFLGFHLFARHGIGP